MRNRRMIGKIATTISIDPDVLDEARFLGINRSAAAQAGIEAAIIAADRAQATVPQDDAEVKRQLRYSRKQLVRYQTKLQMAQRAGLDTKWYAKKLRQYTEEVEAYESMLDRVSLFCSRR